jgi:hypothetical protein
LNESLRKRCLEQIKDLRLPNNYDWFWVWSLWWCKMRLWFIWSLSLWFFLIKFCHLSFLIIMVSGWCTWALSYLVVDGLPLECFWSYESLAN